MLTCGTPWPHTSSAPDGDQPTRLSARRRTHTPPRAVMYAITAQANCTGMPPIGRSIHAPRLAPRSGSACLSECSFSLPLRPSHQPGEAGLLQRVADRLGGGAHTPAVRYVCANLDIIQFRGGERVVLRC
jgi:hypothetical protein